jgi:hypothetical protein
LPAHPCAGAPSALPAYSAASTQPSVGPAKPRQPAAPRPGHAPTPRGRRIPPVPRAGPPSRHRGRLMRAAPLGVAMVEDPASEASPGTPTSSSSFCRRSAKNHKFTSRRALSSGRRCRPVPDRRPVSPLAGLAAPFLFPSSSASLPWTPPRRRQAVGASHRRPTAGAAGAQAARRCWPAAPRFRVRPR